ncbi:IPT/TIG domain-containing protein [Nocardioides perillae]|uniref:IPT/TIG domain-containing protein n=1 Tax=Nocardioides perillae TaxID=1119534 RepID=A0A7Y9UM20_9ACTN|nr:IPT/TIG domain-containing protein [Nocardioides perillae]NYG57073.1 hypothetical protein [Nocardioides perillae]
MSVTGTRSPRTAALITGLVLGGTALSYVPANAAPQLGAAPVVRAATVTPTTVVKRLSENKGPLAGGGTVLITGKDLATGTGPYVAKAVTFGTVTVPTADVTALSTGALQVEVPAGVADTPVVKVLVGDATAGPKYTYELLEATVSTTQTTLSGWAPVSETGLADQVLTGAGFQKTTAVLVGGKRARVTPTPRGTTFDPTRIEFDLPAGLVGVHDVVVADKRGTAYVGYVTYVAKTIDATSADLPYAVNEAATAIPVTGTNLDAVATATYSDGTTTQKATVKKVSATQVVIGVPAGAALNDGTLTLKGAYGNSDTLTLDRQAAGLPTVTAVTPKTGVDLGVASGVVTLTGTNLVSLKAVKVYSKTATVKTYAGSAIKVLSATSAEVKLPKLPDDAAYDIEVVTAHTVPSAKFEFSVGTPAVAAPTVSAVTSADGETVAITGTNLTGTSQVTFTDSVPTTVTATTGITVNSATSVTVVLGSALAAGSYQVVVTTPGGNAAAATLTVS